MTWLRQILMARSILVARAIHALSRTLKQRGGRKHAPRHGRQRFRESHPASEPALSLRVGNGTGAWPLCRRPVSCPAAIMSSPTGRRRHAPVTAKAFGAAVAACLRPGVTVSGVARKAGITRGYLHRLVRGGSQPTLDVILAIADALRISPMTFLALILQKMGRHTDDAPSQDIQS